MAKPWRVVKAESYLRGPGAAGVGAAEAAEVVTVVAAPAPALSVAVVAALGVGDGGEAPAAADACTCCACCACGEGAVGSCCSGSGGCVVARPLLQHRCSTFNSLPSSKLHLNHTSMKNFTLRYTANFKRNILHLTLTHNSPFGENSALE